MIRPIYWILALAAGVLAVILLFSSISLHTHTPTIYDLTNDNCRDIIEKALSDHNANYSVYDLKVVDAQYINDSVAVIKMTDNDGEQINFLFELYNGTVYLTNYSTSDFTSDELNNPDLLHYINDAIAA